MKMNTESVPFGILVFCCFGKSSVRGQIPYAKSTSKSSNKNWKKKFAFLDKLSFSKPLYTFSIFVIVFYYLYVIVFMCCMCAICTLKIRGLSVLSLRVWRGFRNLIESPIAEALC